MVLAAIGERKAVLDADELEQIAHAEQQKADRQGRIEPDHGHIERRAGLA